MILHIISASPFHSDAFQRCCELATAADGILLIEDATLALGNVQRFLTGLPTQQLFVLEPDRLARGLPLPTTPAVNAVDYDGFVGLTARFTKTLSWF